MTNINNLKIGTRLGLAFATLLVLTSAVIGLGISMLGLLSDSLNRINDDRDPRCRKYQKSLIT